MLLPEIANSTDLVRAPATIVQFAELGAERTVWSESACRQENMQVMVSGVAPAVGTVDRVRDRGVVAFGDCLCPGAGEIDALRFGKFVGKGALHVACDAGVDAGFGGHEGIRERFCVEVPFRTQEEGH